MTRAITVTMLLFATISLLMGQQNPTSSRAEPSAVEAFIGAWKFNRNKSSQSGTEKESINIELKDGTYKFTYDWLAENGTELNWWFVTDMKGGCVTLTQVNGQPMGGHSCVTRVTSHKFVDAHLFKDEYEVSADGRILKLHRQFIKPPSVQMASPKDAILVFDKVPQ